MDSGSPRPFGANQDALPADILVGAQAIAKFLYGDEGLKETNLRRVYHGISKGDIPVFRIGGKLHARKSTILRRITGQEDAA